MQKIKTCLWFDGEAEEAAKFYVSVFKNSRIVGMNHYGEGEPRPAGSVLTVSFVLDGQEFMALNGGPEFKFNEAISMVVSCDNQAEIDEVWEKLLAGGSNAHCGWLKDRFGLSWQIVPAALGEMLSDRERAGNVMKALLKMNKLDLAALQEAFHGTVTHR